MSWSYVDTEIFEIFFGLINGEFGIWLLVGENTFVAKARENFLIWDSLF